MPIILCAPLAYTELIVVAKENQVEKMRETADARFGSFVWRNEQVEKGDGRKNNLPNYN